MTAKVYNIVEYRLKRQLKELEADLAKRVRDGEKYGYGWFDHFTIKELNYKIEALKEKIKNEQQRST